MATTMSRSDVAPLDVQAPRRRSWMLVAVMAVVACVVGAGVVLALGQSTDDDLGSGISDAVMVAWATADPEDIAAIYAEDAVFIFDGEPLAAGIGEVTDMIGDVENTYEAVGSVSSHEAADGDLYVSGLVEVVGPGHPLGDPLVVLYRVHDGKVIRHVVIDAEHY